MVYIKSAFISTSLAIALMACGSSHSPKVVQAPSEMVTKVVGGPLEHGHLKPGADVSISYDAPRTIAPGQTGLMTLTFNVPTKNATLSVDFGASDALTLSSRSVMANIDLSTVDAPTHEIDYSSQVEGLHYINAFATLTYANGQSLGRALSLPVQIGESGQIASQKSSGMTVEKRGDKSVIVMDAVETIK